MAGLSDAEVFGAPPTQGVPTQERGLSDDEVFGAPKGMSDNEVFGESRFDTAMKAFYPARAAWELGKSAAQGAVGLFGGGVAGAGATYTTEDAAIDRRIEELTKQGYPVSVAKARAEEELPKPAPITERPIYQAGQGIQKFAESTFTPNPNVYVPQLARDVAGGIGSSTAGIATSLIPGIGPGLSAGLFGAAGSGEAVERAVKAGATPEQQIEASRGGAIAGATDLVDALLPHLGSTGKVLGFIRRVGLRTAKSAVAEGLQEGTQEFIQNLVAQRAYNPDQDLGENVPYNTLVGLISGGLMGGGIAALERGRREPPPSQEQIDAAGNVLKTPPPSGPEAAQSPETVSSLIDQIVGLGVTPAAAKVVTPTTPTAPAATPAAPAATTAQPTATQTAVEAPTASSGEVGFDVWHASPHLFDQFDLEKVGTGEGRQTYGHGVYASDNPEEAGKYLESTAKGLTEAPKPEAYIPHKTRDGKPAWMVEEAGGKYIGQIVQYGDGDFRTVAYAQKEGGVERLEYTKEKFDSLEEAKGFFSNIPERSANLYSARVEMPKESFPVWDAPLGSQPSAVQEVFAKHLGPLGPRELGSGVGPMLWRLNGQIGSKAASDALWSAGMPGIRYPDPSAKVGGPPTSNYVFFNTSIVKPKSRQTAKGAQEMLSMATPARGLYSGLERAVEGVKLAKAPALQWTNTIKNASGVKQEELDWLGLPAWLNAQKKPITKEEVLDFIRENRVEVQEVVKGGEEFNPLLAEWGAWLNQRHKEVGKRNLGVSIADSAARSDASLVEAIGRLGAPAGFLDRYRAIAAKYGGDRPAKAKHRTQKIAGGENFRNLLLTLPAGVEADNFYYRGHFDEPNILASVLMDDRVIDGKLTLFLHEVQSDWHQKGRKQGYRSELSTEKLDSLRKEQVDLTQRIREANLGPMATMRFRREPLVARLREVENELRGGVPDAPFKTAWPELILKRMVRYAADHGYDQISWSPGEVVADRYSLAKHVDSIHTTFEPNLKYRVTVFPKGSESALDQVEKTPQELADFVGKEMADKIIAYHNPKGQGWGGSDVTFGLKYWADDDLKVGGEKMRSFYDRELVNNANKIGKKFGAKVEQKELKYTDASTDAALEAINEALGLPAYTSAAKYLKVATLPITPALREVATTHGFPMFNLDRLTPQAQAQATDMELMLRDIVSRVAGFDVAQRMQLHEGDSIPLRADSPARAAWGAFRQADVLGIYSPGERLIQLALGNPAVGSTAMHEAFHDVEAHLLSQDELKLMEAETPRLRPYVKRMRGYTQSEVEGLASYEIRAMAFQAYVIEQAGGKPTGFSERVKEFFARILNLIQRVKNGLQGLGFRSAEDVFEDAMSGVFARRSQAVEANRRALSEVTSDPPRVVNQPELMGLNDAMLSVFGGAPPTSTQRGLAHAHHVGALFKYGAGLDQYFDANPNFTPLRDYHEVVRGGMDQDYSRILDATLRIGKEWRDLGVQGDKLSGFIHDLSTMVYRSPAEVASGVARHPTKSEVEALVKKHSLSDDALKVFVKIKTWMDGFFDLSAANAVEKAKREIFDPRKLADRIDQIRTQTDQMKSYPYFPFTRFGRHYVFVKNSAGDIIHFETFERRGILSAEHQQRKVEAQQKKTAASRGLGETVGVGILPESSTPFIGMPPSLMDSLLDTLNLPKDAADVIQSLGLGRVYNMAVRPQAINANFISGYSMDLQRSFAKYFFHGGRHYVRTKYAWQLQGFIAEARRLGGVKEQKIAEYMQDHLHNTVLDAKGDFGLLKGVTFLYTMGFSPAAATMNMTQTPMITWPYLASKFGPLKASRVMLKTMAQRSTFYKRGSYDPLPGQSQDFHMAAIAYGIKTGRISETQAAELAALAQGGNLIAGIGGNRIQRGAIVFQERAALMFELAEQFNRRIAYRAALQLALENPNAKVVKEAMNKWANEYRSLKAIHGDARAKAIVTAAHVTDQTQYVYAKSARPRFMRHPLAGTLLIYKKFLQSTLFTLGHNPGMIPYYLFVMMAMGGLGAPPFAEELKGLLQALGRWWFGKDFNLEREVRKYVLDVSNEKISPDLVLHGFARFGFGVPWVVDMIGGVATGKTGRDLAHTNIDPNLPEGDPKKLGHSVNVPFPVLDRSKALSMSVLPVDLNKLIDPQGGLDEAVGEQTQRASGAVFGVAFNMYKFLFDKHLGIGDPKRWERAIPREAAALSQMFRSYSEERERVGNRGPNSAATVVRYDTRDVEHLMEMVAIGLGYNTFRRQSHWDVSSAKMEVEKFYDIQRTGLMEQYNEARKGGRAEEIETTRKSIVQHNKDVEALGFAAKGITGKQLLTSVNQRERDLQMKEMGLSSKKSNIPLDRYINRLYPGATIDVRKVR